MLSSVYKWRLFFIASQPVFAVNNTISDRYASLFGMAHLFLFNPEN